MQKFKMTAVALMLLPLFSGAAMAAKSVGTVNINLEPQSITGPAVPPEAPEPPQ